MRKSSVEVTFNTFFSWMYFDVDLLNKVYSAQRVVGKKEYKKEIFEALVFRFHVNWEILVEELLIDCLNRDTSQYAQYMELKLPKHVSRAQCAAMVRGLSYVDFHSISDIKKTAKSILLPGCNPFQAISRPDSAKIDEFYKIRNYLAHYSSVSKRALSTMYKRAYGMQRFYEPGEFLLLFDKGSGWTRFGNYVNAFHNAAQDMAKFLGIHVENNDNRT